MSVGYACLRFMLERVSERERESREGSPGWGFNSREADGAEVDAVENGTEKGIRKKLKEDLEQIG